MSLLAGTGGAQAPFPDVPPCHWAAPAVARLADPVAPDERRARNSTELARNAPRQVLEGLRCDEPAWSLRFLAGAPDDWRPAGPLDGFELELRDLRVTNGSGTVQARVRLAMAGRMYAASGPLELVFEGGGWRVRYEGLAALELPAFP